MKIKRKRWSGTVKNQSKRQRTFLMNPLNGTSVPGLLMHSRRAFIDLFVVVSSFGRYAGKPWTDSLSAASCTDLPATNTTSQRRAGKRLSFSGSGSEMTRDDLGASGFDTAFSINGERSVAVLHEKVVM